MIYRFNQADASDLKKVAQIFSRLKISEPRQHQAADSRNHLSPGVMIPSSLFSIIQAFPFRDKRKLRGVNPQISTC
jgi:hypothetical protein